jgi:hypothetical protein
MKSRHRALYVALLLMVLAAVQLRAQVLQLCAGYRPFAHPPTRVPYSWDMFAIRLDRCVVGWRPPLEIEGRSVARWHDREAPIEFDTVFNEAGHYVAAAERGCDYRRAPWTSAHLQCFSSDGGVREFTLDCP